jgi:hypothetical protein
MGTPARLHVGWALLPVELICASRRIQNGLNMAAWPNMRVVVRIPRAMPLAMLNMALDQKTFGCFAPRGLRCLWPLAMVLFANGDGHYSQGQRPWMSAQRPVFANGDNQ